MWCTDLVIRQGRINVLPPFSIIGLGGGHNQGSDQGMGQLQLGGGKIYPNISAKSLG